MNDDNKPALSELPAMMAAELVTIGRALSSVSREIICGILDDAVDRANDAASDATYWKGRTEHLENTTAELRAQLAAAQHAACPYCGAALAGEKLAPF